MADTAPRVMVDSGAPPNPLVQLVSYDSLYGYVKAFAEEELFTEVDLPDLIEEVIPEDGYSETGRVVKAFAKYELRYHELRFSHSGLIGKCTPRELAMAVRAGYNHSMQRLRLEQPSAQWQLVAAMVRRDQVNRMFDRTGNVTRAPVYSIEALVQSAQQNVAEQRAMAIGRGESQQGLSNQTVISDTSVAPDFRALLCCVFTDVSQGDLVDPWGHRFPGERGPDARYAETGELRYLKPSLKRERMQAKMLIQRLIESGERLEEGEDVVEEITESTARMAKILRQQGQKWGQIAEAFGISNWRLLKSAVVALDSSLDSDDDGV